MLKQVYTVKWLLRIKAPFRSASATAANYIYADETHHL